MGVRQGENLLPFLFAMFLNDLQMFFENASLNGLGRVSNCIEDKKAQNSFFFFLFKISKNENNVKKLSVVE
jgi:hypothetical protein